MSVPTAGEDLKQPSPGKTIADGHCSPAKTGTFCHELSFPANLSDACAPADVAVFYCPVIGFNRRVAS
ncbi:unnamed protein product [Diabrotica balteata]|uniref:Uncharacterized protein n=1 Tax=Diabrotica balteata TaxID=107213 RepID=A0A9N9X835_DIABA|nr:unnamed protein product [Diabrotica balteata]